jgi:anti-anti-sigma factor
MGPINLGPSGAETEDSPRQRKNAMQISTEELPGGITRVALKKVEFLGSMGLRSIVIPARAVTGRGGKVVLFAPNEMVASVLKTAGIDTLIPVCHDLDAAIALLG